MPRLLVCPDSASALASTVSILSASRLISTDSHVRNVRKRWTVNGLTTAVSIVNCQLSFPDRTTSRWHGRRLAGPPKIRAVLAES